MKVYNEYQILVLDEKNYTFDSSDNLIKYDNVYKSPEVGEFLSSSKHGIQIFKNDDLLQSTLIAATGGATGIFENSYLIKNDNILLCCSDHIFSLELPTLKLKWMFNADIATCKEIFELENDILLHGEFQISRISLEGEIIWTVMGNDIFLNFDQEEVFEIRDGYIYCNDFNNDFYNISFDGKIK